MDVKAKRVSVEFDCELAAETPKALNSELEKKKQMGACSCFSLFSLASDLQRLRHHQHQLVIYIFLIISRVQLLIRPCDLLL